MIKEGMHELPLYSLLIPPPFNSATHAKRLQENEDGNKGKVG